MSDSPTIVNRSESSGRRYPLFVERVLLVLVIAGAWFLHPMVMDALDGAVGTVAAWCGLPLLLLMCAELAGRVLQSVRNDA